jgi:hypothetical protein
MGYSTTFTLEVIGGKIDAETPELAAAAFEKKRKKALKKFLKFSEGADYCLCKDGSSNESGSWYDAEENLVEYSKKYPELIFDLYGEGEETLDAWHCYVQNGKSQKDRAVISFTGFNPEKLK